MPPVNSDKGVDFERSRPAYELLGPLPQDYDKIRNAISALATARISEGVEAEDTDAGTVVILAHLIWLMLLGRWTTAITNATLLAELNLRWSTIQFMETGSFTVWHEDPLRGVAEAISTLARVAQSDPEKAREVAMQCFCVPEGSAAHEYIISASTALTEKEGSRSE